MVRYGCTVLAILITAMLAPVIQREAAGSEPTTEAEIETSSTNQHSGTSARTHGSIRGGTFGTDCWNPGDPLVGPDVIVGTILGAYSYIVPSGDIDAFAFGTDACNIGSQSLDWIGASNRHPVIGQNLFRLKNGRFEHIGQSWLKHGFAAAALNGCGCGCTGPGGQQLDVGCSDPYDGFTNGYQEFLGPKWQVNPYTGVFPYPFAAPAEEDTDISRRLQVRKAEIAPSLNAGAMYFVEAQYITKDDTAAGNGLNNASHCQTFIAKNADLNDYYIQASGSTQREQPAIRAWQNNDPSVVETDIFVEHDGMMILAGKATDLGDGFHHYEYALQNYTSDRAAGSFSVPLTAGTVVRNTGFRDVDYHSGEPFDGTDWIASVVADSITWATIPHAVNSNANALRWGTLYNFWFDANVSPATATLTIGLFKPGTPVDITADSVAPAFCAPAACDDTDPCTTDSCDAGGCLYFNNSEACEDGQLCTTGDFCSQGLCMPGVPAVVLFADLLPPPIGDGVVDLDDLLCLLLGFANLADCTGADLYPCAPANDGKVGVDDLISMLEAFAGNPVCADPCPP
ncbi:MAG: hypothetical protein AABZ47_01200 [Planctomycetota bacterium]